MREFDLSAARRRGLGLLRVTSLPRFEELRQGFVVLRGNPQSKGDRAHPLGYETQINNGPRGMVTWMVQLVADPQLASGSLIAMCVVANHFLNAPHDEHQAIRYLRVIGDSDGRRVFELGAEGVFFASDCAAVEGRHFQRGERPLADIFAFLSAHLNLDIEHCPLDRARMRDFHASLVAQFQGSTSKAA